MVTLVTGATGFLGSRLAHLLRARGEAVRALVRPTSDRRRIADLGVELAFGDVTDRPSVERALEGARTVYHVAALYELGTTDFARMEGINVGGTTHVLEAAAARAIPAVYVSSVAALGPTGAEPASESHWRGDEPRSAYEATKRRAHEVARRIARRGAKLRLAMPVTIYGPDDPSVIGHFHRWYARGFIPVGALPEMVVSFVHVDDCAEGLERIMSRGADGEEYILSAQAVTFRAWFSALAHASGRRPPRAFLPSWAVARLSPLAAGAARIAGLSPHLVREVIAMSGTVNWSFSGDKARRELGFSPRGLDQGMRDVIAFHRPR
jgi:dihydroflavonol-4-reductase